MPHLCAAALALAAACSSAPGPAGPETPEQMLRDRPYRLVIPTAGDAGKALPLLLTLHGHGGSGGGFAQGWGFIGEALQDGFFLAAPDGSVQSDYRLGWNFLSPPQPPDDAGYLLAIVDEVSRNHQIDPRRVFVIGFSQGAFMAHRLACDHADRIAAFISIAGELPDDGSCKPSAPVSMVELHGDHDSVIPFTGDAHQLSAPDTAAVWAHSAGCAGGPAQLTGTLDLDRTLDGAETQRFTYSGCKAGLGVELWKVQGGDHGVSGVPTFPKILFDWLAAHPKP